MARLVRFMRIPVLAGVLAALCGGAAAPATATEVTIRGVTLRAPPPPGHCELDRMRFPDLRIFDVLETGNRIIGRVITVFAQCNQLSEWRSGSRSSLDDYGYVLVPHASFQQDAPFTQKELNNLTKAQLPAGQMIVDWTMERLKPQLDRMLVQGGVDQAEIIGVLAEDDLGLYSGLMMKGRTEAGELKNSVGVFSAAVVAGQALVVNVYLYQRYRDAAAVLDLVEQQKQWLAVIHAMNSSR